MIEIVSYSSINPLILGSFFLVLGGIFGFLGGLASSAVKAVTGINIGGTPKAATVNNQNASKASTLEKTKALLAKAKAGKTLAISRGKTAVAAVKAKMLKNTLMIGGGIAALVAIFFLARRK